MKDVFAKLASDFLSTIVFPVLYLISGDVVLATSVAIAGAVAQLIYARVKGRQLVSVIAVGAKVAAFALQYVAFRMLVIKRRLAST
jgi:intracellular septation protein A